ncbi:MAG: MFS transporter [Hyphomicrobiaceae bacterium]|nr:MFS transporter [Hyphomicrobiaceae bacterium]
MQRLTAQETDTPSRWLILAALAPFGLGYFFSYLYRAVNAVVAPELVRDIGVSASELGLLTSAYLLAFALFQLPLGILLDRFGPRRVQAALVATGATGALLFAISHNVAMLTIARAIIGIGFAGGLMASFKAVVIWVPEPRRALANACVMSAGALGVILSSAPMALAVVAIGWRQAFVWLAAATLAVAALILLCVPERTGIAATAPPAPVSAQLAEVGRIYTDRVFLALVPVLAIPAGAHIALQTLWAGPWFRDVAGLDRVAVGEQLLLTGVSFLVGVLLSGVVADRLVRRGWSLLTVNIGFVLIFLACQVGIILADRLSFVPPVVWWAGFTMTGHTAVLAYPWLASYFGAARSGRSNTAANFMMFGTAFLVQYAVGWVIDLYPPTASGGYDPAGYKAAFGAVLGLEVLALIWYLVNSKLLRDAEPQRG